MPPKGAPSSEEGKGTCYDCASSLPEATCLDVFPIPPQAPRSSTSTRRKTQPGPHYCFFFSFVTFLAGVTGPTAAAAVAAAASLRSSASFSFRIDSSRYHSETCGRNGKRLGRAHPGPESGSKRQTGTHLEDDDEQQQHHVDSVGRAHDLHMLHAVDPLHRRELVQGRGVLARAVADLARRARGEPALHTGEKVVARHDEGRLAQRVAVRIVRL